MNNYELLKILNTAAIDVSTPIPVQLVKQLTRLVSEINHLQNPVFVDEEGNSVMSNWEEFKFIGLNNVDYIKSEFYLHGWEDDKD